MAACLGTEPDLPTIQADRGQLQQVFMNLVLDASEAIGRVVLQLLKATGW